MEISYLGHSSFRLKTTGAYVVTDPYNKTVGWSFPKVSADVVTVSHFHDDHNNVESIDATVRREKPFIVDAPGEYEVGGVSVFGFSSFHDNKNGEIRGKNTIYSILMEGLTIVHLGDLGHIPSENLVAELDVVDVLLCPVGGHYTVNAKEAMEIISAIEPSIVIPMHFKTDRHNSQVFEKVESVEPFLKEWAGEYKKMDKLVLSKASMSEETELVLLESSLN